MAASSPRRSTRATVQKSAAVSKTASRARPARSVASSKTPAYLDTVPSSDDDIQLESEVEVESEDEEDVETEEEEDSSVSSQSASLSDDEDDREIQRIIEKTAAETKNIPMTARQRAAKQAEKAKATDEEPEEEEEEFLSLPMSKPLSEEQMLLKSEKSRRRKMQREQKLEETKRATIERLLTKQRGASSEKASEEASLSVESAENPTDNRIPDGCIRFIDRADATLLIIPEGVTCFSPPHTPTAQSPLNCAVCEKCPRKYTHPASGKAFCSLACFKAL